MARALDRGIPFVEAPAGGRAFGDGTAIPFPVPGLVGNVIVADDVVERIDAERVMPAVGEEEGRFS
jgi:hypothetical protein